MHENEHTHKKRKGMDWLLLPTATAALVFTDHDIDRMDVSLATDTDLGLMNEVQHMMFNYPVCKYLAGSYIFAINKLTSV